MPGAFIDLVSLHPRLVVVLWATMAVGIVGGATTRFDSDILNELMNMIIVETTKHITTLITTQIQTIYITIIINQYQRVFPVTVSRYKRPCINTPIWYNEIIDWICIHQLS